MTTVLEPLPLVTCQRVNETVAQLKDECAGFERFVDNLLDQLERLRAELARRNRQLGQEKQQLDQARQELQQQRQRMEESTDQNAERVTKLVGERESLEAELELVRRRAAGLSQTVAEQEQKLTIQRDNWADELQQMRRLVEQQLGKTRAEPNRQTVRAAAETRVTADQDQVADGDAQDAIVESLAAEFAQLQSVASEIHAEG